ncbi:hypothetical protein [Streptomyces sp. S186]|uniref:hypothetical protein n=1 Tax=Streptomyces sp. S186 TaxID=3434395 RepID=UPI003F661E24
MPVTLTAHQLGRLIDRTIDHISDELTEQLHGIRLDADDTYLYAVASDRHTLAAARYRHHGLDGRRFACTLPAASLHMLREWTGAQPGNDTVTLTLEGTRLQFAAPAGDLRIVIDPDLAFPDWRGTLRTVLDQSAPAGGAAFPAVDTRLLAKFQTADNIMRVRITADRKAIAFFGEDFLGAQMPCSHRRPGFPTDEPETVDQLVASWHHTLTGSSPAPVTTFAATPAHPGDEVTKDITETTAELLRQTLHSTHSLLGALRSPEVIAAHAIAGVGAWTAYRYLDALHTADPKLAEKVVADVAEELDAGELGVYAWDAAEQAGYDPRQWRKEFEAAAAKARITTDEKPPQADTDQSAA